MAELATQVTKTLTEYAEDLLLAMQNATDDETGEILSLAFVEEAQLAFQTKAMRVARMVQILDSREAAIERDLALLKRRKEQIRKAHDWLEGYLYQKMVETGTDKIDDALCVSLRKCPPSVLITDEAAIPAVYKETVITEKVSKDAIKAALKSGVEVPGAKLVTDKTTLTIR